jgi:hypothetical protein
MDAELLHLRVQRASSNPERARSRGAVAARFAQRIENAPSLRAIEPCAERHASAVRDRTLMKRCEERLETGIGAGTGVVSMRIHVRWLSANPVPIAATTLRVALIAMLPLAWFLPAW